MAWGRLGTSWGRLGASWERLGRGLGRLGGVLERFERRLGNVLGGGMGHLLPSRGVLARRLERPQPDFGTKLRHSVWVPSCTRI